jgi:Ca-activated chloride channel family protein
VGLLVFAGNAYMQMPLTADIGAAKLFLNDINTSMAPTQGTAIGAAINLARQAFSQNKKSRKTIIVITDGENFEDDAVQAAAEAQKAGITVNVMGVGSTHGAPIPMPDGGYMTDDEGQPVTTYLNEDMAQKIAQAGKGTYVNGSAANAIDTLRDTLDTLAKTDLDTIDYSQQDELFPWLAALALLLVFAWVALLERKNPWLQKFNFFSRNTKQ